MPAPRSLSAVRTEPAPLTDEDAADRLAAALRLVQRILARDPQESPIAGRKSAA